MLFRMLFKILLNVFAKLSSVISIFRGKNMHHPNILSTKIYEDLVLIIDGVTSLLIY